MEQVEEPKTISQADKLKEMILKNRKRTYDMYMGQHDDKIKEIDSIVEIKLRQKLKQYVSDNEQDEN
jgi:hypothetical protein